MAEDIVGLPAAWRRRAKQEREYFHLVADTLEECAEALEEAWHDHAHDAEFHRGCKFCDRDRLEQYGVVGDGKHDDTEGLQRMITDGHDIPQGRTYLITGTLELS